MTKFSPTNPESPARDEDNGDYFEYYFDEPGSEPGTLSIEPDAHPSRLILIDYDTERATRQVDFDPLSGRARLLDRDSVSWLDVLGLGSRATLEQIGEMLDLHPLLLEDVVNVPQRPKVEDYEGQLLVIAQMVFPKASGEGFETEQVGFVLGERYLVTFQEEPEHDCFNRVRERLRANRGKIRRSGADYLAYALLDAIVDGFFPVLEDYGERVEALENEVVLDPSRRSLGEIYKVRRELLALRRLLWPLRGVLDKLSRGSPGNDELLGSEVEIYFRDCYDHAIQLLDLVENYRELASSLTDVYMSSISNKMNEVVKLLTIISTIFIPLTFVAGIYGMNFEYMPELGWRWGYFTCLGAMVAIAASLVVFFWRRGWFESFSKIEEE